MTDIRCVVESRYKLGEVPVWDVEEQARIGKQSRALAEREFALEGCADRFEEILVRVGS